MEVERSANLCVVHTEAKNRTGISVQIAQSLIKDLETIVEGVGLIIQCIQHSPAEDPDEKEGDTEQQTALVFLDRPLYDLLPQCVPVFPGVDVRPFQPLLEHLGYESTHNGFKLTATARSCCVDALGSGTVCGIHPVATLFPEVWTTSRCAYTTAQCVAWKNRFSSPVVSWKWEDGPKSYIDPPPSSTAVILFAVFHPKLTYKCRLIAGTRPSGTEYFRRNGYDWYMLVWRSDEGCVDIEGHQIVYYAGVNPTQVQMSMLNLHSVKGVYHSPAQTQSHVSQITAAHKADLQSRKHQPAADPTTPRLAPPVQEALASPGYTTHDGSDGEASRALAFVKSQAKLRVSIRPRTPVQKKPEGRSTPRRSSKQP